MKKMIALVVIAILSCVTVNAQDSTTYKKPVTMHSYDSIPNPSDTTKKTGKWNKDKMPNEKRKKNWPDSMGRIDSLRHK